MQIIKYLAIALMAMTWSSVGGCCTEFNDNTKVIKIAFTGDFEAYKATVKKMMDFIKAHPGQLRAVTVTLPEQLSADDVFKLSGLIQRLLRQPKPVVVAFYSASAKVSVRVGSEKRSGGEQEQKHR